MVRRTHVKLLRGDVHSLELMLVSKNAPFLLKLHWNWLMADLGIPFCCQNTFSANIKLFSCKIGYIPFCKTNIRLLMEKEYSFAVGVGSVSFGIFFSFFAKTETQPKIRFSSIFFQFFFSVWLYSIPFFVRFWFFYFIKH